MAGEFTPVVMLPRYSTLVGEAASGTPDRRFTTIAMDVTEYQTAILNVWRGKMPTDTSFKMTCQESTDGQTWANCSGTNVVDYDPTQDIEGQVSATLKKRWFRIAVELGIVQGTPYPQVTCWVVGFLEERQQ